MTAPEINQEVVRSKGDYVVGRVGTIIAIDSEKQRAQVDWNTAPKSWVAFTALEPTSKPYEIIPGYDDKKKGRFVYQKYKSL